MHLFQIVLDWYFLTCFFAFEHPIYREVEYNELRDRVVMPDAVRKARYRNHTFTEGTGEKSHQGGDFMLEQRVKRMRMISPKGAMSTEMWERVARNVDPVGKIVNTGMSLLNIHENDQYSIRFAPIEKELVKWIAQLRFTGYLHTSSEFVLDIHGNLLNAELKNFIENIGLYRKEYFKLALKSGLENIRYVSMNVKSDDIMEEIQPYIPCDSDDDC